MNTGNARRWLALSITTAALAGGCGGSSSAGGGEVVRTEGGEVIRTAGGSAVTVEAHNHWTEGLRMFSEYETQGWNAQRCDDAESKFQQAVRAQGGAFAEAQYMMGLARTRCGDTSGARRHYERALQANATMCSARVGIALIEQEAGNVPQARTMYEQAIADDGQCTTAYVNLARIQADAGGEQEEEALRNIRRALAVEADYLPAFNEMALIYYRRGDSARSRSSLDLAEIVCRQAEIINSRYAPIYNTWGLIKMRRGDLIEALRFFERAIQLDNSMFEAQMNFAQITNSFRGYEDARRAFGRAVELQPRNYDAIIGLGAAQRGLGQIDEAERSYTRARELDPRRPEAYYNLALLFQDYKSGNVPDLERAKQLFQEFLQRSANNPRYTEPREMVSRRCRDQPQPTRQVRGRRQVRPRRQCRPGRVQLIEETIAAIREGESMQREMEAMQRQQDAQNQ